MRDKTKQTTILQMDILDLWVQGLSRREIAERLDCSVATVDSVKQMPELKKLYYERQSAQIEALVPLAIQRLDRILHDDKQQGAVHIAAVREVLDRSHLKELLEVAQTDLHVTVSYE